MCACMGRDRDEALVRVGNKKRPVTLYKGYKSSSESVVHGKKIGR